MRAERRHLQRWLAAVLPGTARPGAAAVAPPAPPSSRRAAQWLRELGHRPDAVTRGRWRREHGCPRAEQLHDVSAPPLPPRRARRLLRGVSRLPRKRA